MTSFLLSVKARFARPYPRVFRLRGPVAERDDDYVRESGSSCPGSRGPRLGRRALDSIALRSASFLT
jgi:hypothetical protein